MEEKGKKKTEYPRAYHGTLAVAGSGGRHIEVGFKDLQINSNTYLLQGS